MPFEAATCPNCGGNLQLDDSMESGFCNYCGSKIIVRDAIQRYKVEISGRVSMSGISTVENDIKRGQQCLDVSDWSKAKEIFSHTIDKQADSYEAWMGYLTAITAYFQYIIYDVKLDGSKGLNATMQCCYKYAPSDKKKYVLNMIKKIYKLEVDSERIEYRHNRRVKLITGIVILALVGGTVLLSILLDDGRWIIVSILMVLFGLGIMLLGTHGKNIGHVHEMEKFLKNHGALF